MPIYSSSKKRMATAGSFYTGDFEVNIYELINGSYQQVFSDTPWTEYQSITNIELHDDFLRIITDNEVVTYKNRDNSWIKVLN